ncbi:magnesium transporter MgtE N-terminal domain-containing protein [Acetobacter oeni]|uniref:Magnesium transporter MgtE intracellular domain-containing protein n=1 Tax=Acetobacter oeni TaxID=304077 RepID=A0A511XH13_9PROT|nr:hypothetical protein [Acetobacter oeni]MBB3882338.1 flagellar motility protein MotE (MotC chaperone) [Acetobacter oeni]NHO18557.1 hypothetical protein [Acetobacter oeni]GBR02264.1 hypothetical protein AA21952_0690 [Acetobacter oeni LMG 21952]GEN62201.1 hypothetical protein AOE01nite_04250 [Acetobacter oeni]
MPKISFPRVFQLSACLMAGVFSLKAYLLTSSLLFANTPAGATVQAAGSNVAQTAGPAAGSGTAQAQQKSSVSPAGTPAEQIGAVVPPGQGIKPADEKNAGPCSGGATCVGEVSQPDLDVDHRADAARQALLTDLGGRTRQLDEESRKLDDMKRTIEASQAALDVRLQKYSQEQSNMAAVSKEKKQLSDADIDRLVKIYESMAPRDAASIFNVLDFQVVVPVMTKMNPRKTSAILAGMSPDRAMMVTQLLAGMPRKGGMVRAGTNG